jgi:hypothetical protein
VCLVLVLLAIVVGIRTLGHCSVMLVVPRAPVQPRALLANTVTYVGCCQSACLNHSRLGVIQKCRKQCPSEVETSARGSVALELVSSAT